MIHNKLPALSDEIDRISVDRTDTEPDSANCISASISKKRCFSSTAVPGGKFEREMFFPKI
jgi:hypothetical protein